MSSAAQGVHAISDRFVDEYAALDPNSARNLGVSGFEDQLTDYSPAGHEARAELLRRTIAQLRVTEAADQAEQIAKDVFLERAGLHLEEHDAGLDLADLNVLTSPVQEFRQIFDLMPTETAQDWQAISSRLAKLPKALQGMQESLSVSAANSRTPALRQVQGVIEQCETWSGQGKTASFFVDFINGAGKIHDISDTFQDELARNATAAAEGYRDFARFLREELAPSAPVKDAVGEERYQFGSRYFLGAQIDLREAYDWGWEEFSRIEQEMKQIADRIKPGASLAEAADVLNADPRYLVHGQKAFQAWVQELSDQALSDLRGTHFDIPEPLMTLDCKIPPPGGALAPYYVPPTPDFSRAGSMWWPLPEDKVEFPIWRDVTTVYHEGVPGHHLQVGTVVAETERLNRFQRLLAWSSGYGEGWALYAERLMRELGYLDDDGALLGMLDAQLFRAARVIIDIGMHLELEIPAGSGFHAGERWTPELGLEFMLTRTLSDPAFVRSEIDRYLGWIGQAPSYKLGERLWLSARDEVKQRAGADFDLKDFHHRALTMGPMGLDLLRTHLTR